MLETIKRDLKPLTWALMALAVVINGAGGWVISKLDLPLYLDSIGTIFIAVVAGPIAGALTGVLTNVILGFISPAYIPYWPVPLGIGLVAGLCANARLFRTWRGVFISGLLVALTAASLSTLVAMRIHGSATWNAIYFLVQEPVDKVITALIVMVTLVSLPEKFLALLPRHENTGN